MTTTDHPANATSVNTRWSLRSLSLQELQVELSHVRHRLSRAATPTGQRLSSRPVASTTTALRHREKAIVEELAYRASVAT
ncbi:hypothetical protein [Lapillicoccus sp.]|uniref:hypothetical protein n=1 Tax=Lapillicoccus sp. TaxID=1909287 RepID=UPI003263A393